MSLCPGPGLLILDEDDKRKPIAASGWDVVVFAPGSGGAADRYNLAFEAAPDQHRYILAGDDLIPEPSWREVLIETPKGEVWYGDDGVKGAALATHPAIGGRLASLVGWLTLPGTKHFCTDRIWMNIASRLGVLKYKPDAVAFHDHKPLKRDETGRRRGNPQNDIAVMDRFMRDEFPGLIERIKSEL